MYALNKIFQNGFHQQDIIIPSASQGLSGDAGNGEGRYPPPSIAARRRPSGATYPPPGPAPTTSTTAWDLRLAGPK